MTISYSDSFLKLIFRWKGSLWKSLWNYLLVFLIMYYTLNLTYRFGLSEGDKRTFEFAVVQCNEYTKQIPLTFVLGFYIMMVVRRWWQQWENVAWVDLLMYRTHAYVRGSDEESCKLRRIVARYSVLTCALAWRNISIKVLNRFPTLEHLMRANLMTYEEYHIYSNTQLRTDAYRQWFVPILWIQNIFVKRAQDAKLTGPEIRALTDALDLFREPFMKLFSFNWVSIPLVYTQVTTMAVYGYFGLCLFGSQMLDPRQKIVGFMIDFYVPFFTILQFLFYFGWLKVGEDLINPFGEDDEDFELNYLLDRHLEVAFLIAESPANTIPTLVDTFEGKPIRIPYTEAAMASPDKPPVLHMLKTKEKLNISQQVLFEPLDKSQLAQIITPKPPDDLRHHQIINMSQSTANTHNRAANDQKATAKPSELRPFLNVKVSSADSDSVSYDSYIPGVSRETTT